MVMKKKCDGCKKEIYLTKDKYVILGTYNIGNTKETAESFFHFNCWKDYFNKAIDKKLQLKSTATNVLGNTDILKGINPEEILRIIKKIGLGNILRIGTSIVKEDDGKKEGEVRKTRSAGKPKGSRKKV